MTIVAIHQPNYLPWLGYFAKIAQSDVFVLLDDVQYSKNSYINRVQVLPPTGEPKWLTIPVSAHLGQTIAEVAPAKPSWIDSHQATLQQYYRKSPHFKAVWPTVAALYAGLPAAPAGLAAINGALVQGIAALLGLPCRFVCSSALALPEVASDDRLVEIVRAVAPKGGYLSGKGGANYQDPDKFARAGLGFAYSRFRPLPYPQGRAAGEDFCAGLSVLDAAFALGWDGVAELITQGLTAP